jgi:cell division septation protein DedD
MRPGLLRNVEQIQEAEGRPRGSRSGTLLLAALGTACIVFALVTQARRKAAPAVRTFDPLSELVAQAKSTTPGQGTELGGGDVTFPSLLSDEGRTTTALAAVRGGAPSSKALERSGEVAGLPAASADRAAPPPATDRLAVVPLPPKNIVGSSPLASRPRDALTQLAKEASSVTTPPVDAGRAGGYQLQTSSFRSEEEAGLFATALRRRGHRAYVEAAQVAGRGSWYRVRVGPFHSKAEATNYRAEFEKREHLVPFLVEPPKDKGSVKIAETQPAKIP